MRHSFHRLSDVWALCGAFGLLAACGGPGSELEATRWQAVEIDGVAVAIDPAPMLSFAEPGVMNGSGGCNAFRGEVTFQEDGRLSVDRMAGTQRACPEDQMRLELTFLQALTAVERYDLEGDRMRLYGAGDAPLIRLVRAGT